MKPPTKIVPPLWAGIYLVLALLLHYFWLKNGGVRLAVPILGFLCLLAGFGIIIWAWKLFHAKGTSVHPFEESSHLVVEGPYQFTRNPMYLGVTLILSGIAFFAGTPPAFLAPAGFFLTVNFLFVPYEEKKMTRIFGRACLEYQSRVRRWI